MQVPEALPLTLHPDDIMCRRYKETSLDVRPYQPAALCGRTEPREGGFRVALSNGRFLHAESRSPHILRLRITPDATPATSVTEQLGLLSPPACSAATFTEDGQTIRLSTGQWCLSVRCQDAGFRVTTAAGEPLIATRDQGLRFSPEAPDFSGQRFLGFFELADQQIYGFGGRTARPNRRGLTADMFAVKAGVDHGDYGGFPLPFFLSSRGYGLFFNNPWPHVYFDMGKTLGDTWFLHAPGGDCDLFIIHGPEFADIVRRFTDMVGRIPIPRRWWMGYWCSSLSFLHAKPAIEQARRMRVEGYPIDGLVYDAQWRAGPEFLAEYGRTHKYLANDIHWHPDFGDGPETVSELAAMRVKTILHINSRPFADDTAARGIADGLLRRQGEEVVVNVGDPKSETFYSGLLRDRIREGIGMWWLDHGDRISGEIRGGVPSRNLFGSMWARATADAMAEHANEPAISLARGGGIGAQPYCMPWPGDTGFGHEFFGGDLWFAANAGLCGFPLTSADLGGFMPAKSRGKNEEAFNAEAYDDDNICRRMLQSLFILPCPRMHDSGQALPKFPWNCKPAIRPLYKAMLELRYRLTPYFYSYAVQAAATGAPIVRPLVYAFRQDARVYDIVDEFMIGDDVLVAPVMQARAETRDVYLPAGRWINFWTDERIDGPRTLTVETPLLELAGFPMFLRAGAILPSQMPFQYQPDMAPEALILDIHPDGDSCFTLHEEAGAASEFHVRSSGGDIHIRVRNALTVARAFALRLHHCADRPRGCTSPGSEPGIGFTAWDPVARVATAHITVPAGGETQVTWALAH